MNNLHELLTIGEMSKLVDVSVKSLRYYEKIGILKPVFVNPDNDYRYYAYAQLNMVFAIKFYISLGIPLSNFNNFIDPTTNHYNFRKQITFGIEAGQQYITEIQDLITTAKILQKEMDRSTSILESHDPILSKLPEKHCLCIPFPDNVTEKMYFFLVKKLLKELKIKSIPLGDETGILYRKTNTQWKAFVFVDVQSVMKDFSETTSYFYIPEQDYLCKKASFSELQEEDFLPTKSTTAIFSELFTDNYNYREPLFELRWNNPS